VGRYPKSSADSSLTPPGELASFAEVET
jgi:hypothetical protein